MKYYKVPAITVTPIEVNTRLKDLIASVDARQGSGGIILKLTVTPAGKIYMPGIGTVCCPRLDARRTPRRNRRPLRRRDPRRRCHASARTTGPRFIYVMGEVAKPGQFTMTGPTTLMGAIAMAGGWNSGCESATSGGLSPRRRLAADGDDARHQRRVYGRRPAPADEIWLNDSDIVVVPKTNIQATDDLINHYFTRGLYSLFPQFAFGQFNFNNFREIAKD